MPTKKPSDRLPKQASDLITISAKGLEATTARWEETRRNQVSVINRLQAKIDLVREIADSPSISPEEALHKIQEIL